MTISIAIQLPDVASTGIALTEPRLKIRAATHVKAAHILRTSGATTYETKAGRSTCSASIVIPTPNPQLAAPHQKAAQAVRSSHQFTKRIRPLANATTPAAKVRVETSSVIRAAGGMS